jgi:hypothetical protein
MAIKDEVVVIGAGVSGVTTASWLAEAGKDEPGTGVRMAPVLTVGDLPPATAPPPQVALIPDLRACEPEELPDGYAAALALGTPVPNPT